MTKFTIQDLSGASNQVVFNNISQAGALIDSGTYTVPANGTLRIATPEANRFAASETHWAVVGSQGPVGVNLFFEFESQPNTNPINTVGFNDTAPRTSWIFPVELQLGNTFHTLGLAMANTGSAATTVTLKLANTNATQLGTGTVNIPAFGQAAVNVGTIFSAQLSSTNDFIGSLIVTSSGGAPISVVGVGDDVGPFFSEGGMFAPAPSGGGSANISASVTLTSADAINAGTCIQKGATATGATSAMSVAISPQGDPTVNGLNKVIWSAFVDAPDHVTAQFCKFATGFADPINPQIFNLRVLTGSSASSTGTVVVPAGTSVAAGSCVGKGNSVAGAATNSVIVATPAGDPANAGLADTQWQGFADSAGHVTVELCKSGAGGPTSSTALNFNVAVLN